MPRRVVPMLATTAALPGDDGWAFEIKWDGVRALTYVEDGALHMESRNLLDITPRYPEIAPLAAALRGRAALLDGEVVAFDEQGRPSFGRLQGRMHLQGRADVNRRMNDTPVAYMVFDLLWLDGRSLLGLPWTERRSVLEDLELAGDNWRTPSSHIGDGADLLAASRSQGLEGIVAKAVSSTYEPGKRSRQWVKVKNQRRQEVVIGGWLPGAGNRSGRLGALLVGVHDDTGVLRYSGRVGTGFTDVVLADLGRRLAAIGRDDPPFADPPRNRQARWVEPELVCDVEFTEWTHNGTLRHPSYKGLRSDKSPGEVIREPLG
ncbi:MAG TPA: non-homologous end-joining DNA ligase [Acidimicrobiales bacterium]|nr:non-homologous end-joining DNA ligase [Acidimicrobiales bacterium]